MAQLEKLDDRVRELEQHVEHRDGVIDQLTEDLRRSQSEVSALHTRMEEAEMNSRLPCLILSGQSAGRGGGGRGAARGGDQEQREDINTFVIDTLNRCFPGLGVGVADLDRVHRLPGAGNRVIIRFVRSGEGSIRDTVMSRRLELRGKELYVSESLTKTRSLTFRSLLAAKKDKRLHIVCTRGC
ncbi:hypothetical protein FJT64_004470 [Amphibalanus amphitrite]|uniref:Uncharacterized protein n=1 Tax=Amphibalanus amphitrite TaxID=1232801 RepID=A0A6A4VZ84_AMPAM|nr:hypothetical protein FJT64_004470 [Amphibalanus amphitrite]